MQSAAIRPLHPALSVPTFYFWKHINWQWWLMRLPVALLAVPAAYGVGAFAHEHLPLWTAIIAGAGFEAAYIGAIAVADQQHDVKDRFSTGLWWLVNLGAVIASIASNLLFVSDFQFANVVAESYVHAVPMPVLGFLYGLLLHRNATKAILLELQAEEQERKREEEERFKCGRCGRGFATPNRLNGHKRHCK